MNIEELTVAQIRQIATIATSLGVCGNTASVAASKHPERPVIVCTDKRGVVFGYADDIAARPILLKRARMCLYWSADVGGVFGLAEKGPSASSKVSATLPEITLEGVTAVMSVDETAEKAWLAAKIQGR